MGFNLFSLGLIMIPVTCLLAVKQNKNPWRSGLYRSMVFQDYIGGEKCTLDLTVHSSCLTDLLDHLRTIMLSGTVARLPSARKTCAAPVDLKENQYPELHLYLKENLMFYHYP